VDENLREKSGVAQKVEEKRENKIKSVNSDGKKDW
jgi:hypothetical protein